jgi:hypothetical protein
MARTLQARIEEIQAAISKMSGAADWAKEDVRARHFGFDEAVSIERRAGEIAKQAKMLAKLAASLGTAAHASADEIAQAEMATA